MTGSLFARKAWYTADLHLGHARIIELCKRPFETVDEMNRAIIDRWNERVDPEDTVFVLGDFAMGTIKDTLALADRLHGYKILVAGNHDRCFHGYKVSRDPDTFHTPDELAHWVGLYQAAGFSSVVTGKAMLKRTGRPVTVSLRPAFGEDPMLSVQLSHFPRTGESDPERPDRYERYRPRPVAKSAVEPWLIHGHVHNAWTINGRQVNVGVDVWDFAPVSSETLISLIAEGMPSCDCPSGLDDAASTTHLMGSPGCVLNGG